MRGHVVSALQKRDDVEVISSKDAEAARQRLGVQWGSSDAYRQVGAELGASAFVEGTVSKDKKKWKANVRVRDASTGLPTDEKTWVKKSLPQLSSVEGAFWGDLGPAIQGTSAPGGGRGTSGQDRSPSRDAQEVRSRRVRGGSSRRTKREEEEEEEQPSPPRSPSSRVLRASPPLTLP